MAQNLTPRKTPRGGNWAPNLANRGALTPPFPRPCLPPLRFPVPERGVPCTVRAVLLKVACSPDKPEGAQVWGTERCMGPSNLCISLQKAKGRAV